MTAPCKGCPDRDYPHCHMVCERYKEYRAEREEIMARKAEIANIREIKSIRLNKWEREELLKRKRKGL